MYAKIASKILVAGAFVALALALNLEQPTPTLVQKLSAEPPSNPSNKTVSQLFNELPSDKKVNLLQLLKEHLEERSNSGRTEAQAFDKMLKDKKGDCEAGQYFKEDVEECKSCAEGKFSDESESTSCKVCAEGHSSEAGATGCSACEAGQFDSGDTCSACAAGQFQGATGASHCTPCDEGSVAAEEGSVECTPCMNGKHTIDGKTCVDNVCVCDHGTPATGAACISDDDKLCAAGCNAGYVLEGEQCTPFSVDCCGWINSVCCGYDVSPGQIKQMCKITDTKGDRTDLDECKVDAERGTCADYGFRC